MKKLVVFDLDGTLTNTLEDINDNLNLTLRRFGFGEITLSETRKFVGDGARKLVSRAIKTPPPDNFEDILAYYNGKYNFCGSPKTKVYDGVKELVLKLKKAGYKLAVLSNKPQAGAEEVVKKFFGGVFDCVFGQRQGVKPKPDKDCVFSLLKELNISPENAVMIGDGETDAMTAVNAGVDGVSVLWGYRSKEELLNAGAKKFVSSAEELYNVINGL